MGKKVMELVEVFPELGINSLTKSAFAEIAGVVAVQSDQENHQQRSWLCNLCSTIPLST